MKPVRLETVASPKLKATLVGVGAEGGYDLALAAARACYSARAPLPKDVQERHRQEIGPSIIAAGHHTPFQHQHLSFLLEGVSRHAVWACLHSHPFYNSEQQSQRYVEMSAIEARVPQGLEGEARQVFEQALRRAWGAYAELGQALGATTLKRMAPFGRVKGQDEKAVAREATKKAIEVARYILPLAAHTSLYHTLSALDLARLLRSAGAGDCPVEGRELAEAMAEALRRADPGLAEALLREPLPAGERPEAAALSAAKVPAECREPGPGDAFVEAFDRRMPEGALSALASATPDAEALVAEALRESLGLLPGQLNDAEALACLLDPGRNPLLLETMNHWAWSPAMRALNHAQYSFKKRLSHSADSQDQRHRVVPASRPLLSRTHTSQPDVVLPRLLAEDPAARALFEQACAEAWRSKNRLLELGVAPEDAVLVLPNAVRVRYTQSGSLLGLLHKWRMRTCFLAQEEIYEASMQELAAVAALHPALARHIGPPCLTRRGRVPDDGRRGPCPEGERWCGISVWLNFPKVKRVF